MEHLGHNPVGPVERGPHFPRLAEEKRFIDAMLLAVPR